MREQVCIYMSPWPRIQGAMLDEKSLVVTYNDWRGEPRGKHRKTQEPDAPPLGDCIDCEACVAVCPVGIDIRNGQQLECITCALCIDACDDVMERIGKPRGLVDYCTLSDETAVAAGGQAVPIWRRIVRPRTVLYTALWSAIGVGLLVALFLRSDMEISVAAVRNPTFVMLSDGSVRNIYDVRLRNKSAEERAFRIALAAPEGLTLALEGQPAQSVTVPADSALTQRVYVTAEAGAGPDREDRTPLRFWLERAGSAARVSADSFFNGRTE